MDYPCLVLFAVFAPIGLLGMRNVIIDLRNGTSEAINRREPDVWWMLGEDSWHIWQRGSAVLIISFALTVPWIMAILGFGLDEDGPFRAMMLGLVALFFASACGGIFVGLTGRPAGLVPPAYREERRPSGD